MLLECALQIRWMEELWSNQTARLLADHSALPFLATPRPVSIKEAIKIKRTILFKSPSSTNMGSRRFMATVVGIAQSCFASPTCRVSPTSSLLARMISGALVGVRTRRNTWLLLKFPPSLPPLLHSPQGKERLQEKLQVAQRSEWWGGPVWVSCINGGGRCIMASLHLGGKGSPCSHDAGGSAFGGRGEAVSTQGRPGGWLVQAFHCRGEMHTW